MSSRSQPFSRSLERALRRSATWHQEQTRRGSGVPYVAHPMAVALILDRLGFDEETVIAGLLHDAVEDTDATLAQIEAEFGAKVAEMVQHCSEIKKDAEGRTRPWIDRKTDHLAALEDAPVNARAIVMADKLHNLMSILVDLEEGRPLWDLFHAERSQVLWYYRISLDRLDRDDPRLAAIAAEARQILQRIEALDPP